MERLFYVRMFLLPTGALANFGIANLIISDRGVSQYAVFALLTSIPTLLPFLDLGFGSSVFNIYSTESDRKKSLEVVKVAFFSLIFILLIFLLLVTLLLTLNIGTSIFANLDYTQLKQTSFTLIALTVISTPMALATRKLQTEHAHMRVAISQSLSPIISFILILVLTKLTNAPLFFLIITPSLVNLLITVNLFFASKMQNGLRIPKFPLISTHLPEILKLGFWFVVLNSFYPIFWQIPRLKFQIAGDTQSVANFSLVLLILAPSFSLIASIAIWLSPHIRQANSEMEKFSLVKRGLKRSLILVSVLNICLISAFFVSEWVGLDFPSFTSTVLVCANNYLIPFWVIPLSRFTERIEVRWFVKLTFPIVAVMTVLFIRSDYSTLNWVFPFYLYPIQIVITIICWSRLRYLTK